MAASASVDSSLWWDSFSLLLSDLEAAPVSDDLPPHLAKKLQDNHAWLLGVVSCFKPQNPKSKEALNSQQVNVGSHKLIVRPQLKDAALEISSYLRLDEVQSYILVSQFLEQKLQNNIESDFSVEEFIDAILLQHYNDRQCLLKCSRQILMHALYCGVGSKEGSAIWEVVQRLVSDDIESKLFVVLQNLLLSSLPEQMDIRLFTLWAEEILIEENLVLDILFLAYESFCTCNGECWRKLCSLYKEILLGSFHFDGKLAVSAEAVQSIFHVKVQLLFILMETLDMGILIQMVHDETPLSQDSFVFSITDIQEMDAIISTFNAFEIKEAGPLIFSWAVFLCLLSSLPGTQENGRLMEINHVSYVRQAFEAASLNCFLEILQNDLLPDLDGPVSGYRRVLRTFVSAFIASYEINLQLEDATLKLILDILCKIYREEESLCVQFWDRDYCIDAPLRCFLSNLEAEFPLRIVELVRLLSALCEGSWPAECVYNFLDKSVGLSSLFEIGSDNLVDNNVQIVETQFPLHVPGVEGLIVPCKTRGRILRVIDGNVVLVRWEFTESGMLVLLLRLARELYVDSNEEVFAILDLLCRLVTFNTAVCFNLIRLGNSLHVQATRMNGQLTNIWVDVVEIICMLIRNSSRNSCGSAVLMSMGTQILAKMLLCSPSRVTAAALKGNIFEVSLKNNTLDVGCNVSASNMWFLSGRLAKLLLIDNEQNDNRCPLTISVLEFTAQLLETGIESDDVLALVVFSLQYILVNHEYWKYKSRHVRWKVTLKVLEVMKKCIMSFSVSQKQGEVIRNILLTDSSIHSNLFRVICTTTPALEKLYITCNYEFVEIEGMEAAVCSGLDITFNMLSKLPMDISSRLPVFHQLMLSPTTKPISVAAAMISLLSYFRNPAIQVGAARVLSMLFMLADCCAFGNACFGLDDNQIQGLRHSVNDILCEHSPLDKDRFVAIIKMLTFAARYQPAFLLAVIATKADACIQPSNSSSVEQPTNEVSFELSGSRRLSLLHALRQYVERSDELIKSDPRVLLNVLEFLKALWEGAAQYKDILLLLKKSEIFWKQLANSISITVGMEPAALENYDEKEMLYLAYRYQCQSAVLELMAYDMFLQKKMLRAESIVNQIAESSNKTENVTGSEKLKSVNPVDLKGILSGWCGGSILGDLIKSYASCEYKNEIYLRLKVAASLFTVHVMVKLTSDDIGSLSAFLIEKICVIFKKLTNLSSFSELIAQYSQHGYSKGEAHNALVLNDLFYHLEGQLRGRKIEAGPFKELSQYLLESNISLSYKQKYEGDLFAFSNDVYVFELKRLQVDLGLDVWDHSEWKAYRAVADTLLLCMQETNSMLMVSNSKLSALKALTNLLSVAKDDRGDKNATMGGGSFEKLFLSCIDHVCHCLRTTIESLAPALDASKDILDFLAAQAELLLHLVRFIYKGLPLTACLVVLKTSGFSLRLLSDLRPSVSGVKVTVELLLTVLLLSIESYCLNSCDHWPVDTKSSEISAEATNVCLGLLPILCKYIETAEFCTICLTSIDLILKHFSTSSAWFPIMQKHFPLKHVILKLKDKNSSGSIPIILKFCLTLARVRGGSEMLLTIGFFQALRELFADLSDGKPFLTIQSEKGLSITSEKIQRSQHVWGFGIAVVTAVIHSLGDGSRAFIADNLIPYFFSEKGHMISYYLTAPDFPSDTHDRKRARSQRTQTSLTFLKETEHTVMLICALAKHQDSWIMKDSQLRERSIHFLAFISRGIQRRAESSTKFAPLLCPPVLKEEIDFCKKPSFINSRSGWFALSPLCCVSKLSFADVSTKTPVLLWKDQVAESTNLDSQTYFSDTIAIQIYRIAFLLLKFLCLQAEGAIRTVEEVGFVDLAHFPELPVPEILHGLQNQAVAIVTELCDQKGSKVINPEIQSVCILLVQIIEMSSYLELCVSRVCGIRPVLGHIEDFSKDLKLLFRVTEAHEFLKAPVKSLKLIISLFYPGFFES